MISGEEGNLLIKSYLVKKKPFLVGRVGVEVRIVDAYDETGTVPDCLVKFLSSHCGYYGDCLAEFCAEYLNGIKSSDIQIIWDINTLVESQEKVFKKHSAGSIKASYQCVEPFYFNDPWSEELTGLNVLVINPFKESIESQYLKKDKIWGNKKILPDFNLIAYKSVQSLCGHQPHSSWLESLNTMKDDIAKIDFDVALLGCGSYGMPLCAYIKNELHKSAIYVGGGLQILFGIKGKRWDDMPFFQGLYNEHWVRPLENEKPKNFNIVEEGCYW